MEIARIVRCIGVAVFAVSLQAGAQPPEGKGKPKHAGTSPFIRFPVPQHSVGVVPHSQAAAVAERRAGGLAGKAFNEVTRADGRPDIGGNAFGKNTTATGGPAGKSFNDVTGVNSPAGVGGNGFGKSTSAAPVVFDSPSGAFSANAAKLPEPVVLASGAGSSPAQRKASPPECGAR